MRAQINIKNRLNLEARHKKDWLILAGYPCLCLTCILLSMCFEIAEKQLLAISLIAGIRWIFIDKNNEVKILIIERS